MQGFTVTRKESVTVKTCHKPVTNVEFPVTAHLTIYRIFVSVKPSLHRVIDYSGTDFTYLLLVTDSCWQVEQFFPLNNPQIVVTNRT